MRTGHGHQYEHRETYDILKDLRKRQERLRRLGFLVAKPVELIPVVKAINEIRLAEVKKKIAVGWHEGNLTRMGATNNADSFERLFYPKPGPMPDILKAHRDGW